MKQKRRLDAFLGRPKVQQQLFIVFVLLLLIPVALCCFFLLNSLSSLRTYYEDLTYSDNLRVKSILFDVTTNIYNSSESLYQDDALLSILNTSYGSVEDMRKDIDNYKGIHDLMYKDTSISSIDIYTLNDTIGDYSNFHTATEQLQNIDWFQEASKRASVFWRTYSRTDSYGNTYWELSFYRKLLLPKTGSYAVLAIRISDNYLRNRIINNNLDCMLSVNQNPVFFSTDKSVLGQEMPANIDYDNVFYSSHGTMEIDGKETIAAISSLQPLGSDDMLYTVCFNDQALKEVHQLLRNYLLVLIATILIPVLLFLIYSRYFSARIMTLRRAMYQASHENYEIMDSFTGNDELSETFQDLRTMIDKIKDKEAQIYEAQIRQQTLENRQQQMEFKMLASQINPHFLYNTLETIRMKAFTSGDREVANAIKLLGKSLRYVLENTGTVSISLEKEINHIRTYAAIQRLRFGDRVNLIEHIEPGLVLQEYTILPLLLQPIVENSIIHGLEGVETNGQIRLEIYETNGKSLCIRISDNGNGMTMEELTDLRRQIMTRDETRTRSIGLYNINQRLQLCYGPACCLEINSEKGKGTSVMLRLPLDKLKEVTVNESSDRR